MNLYTMLNVTYILMKKMIIVMRKIHVTMKSFALATILQPFQFDPEQKKMCGSEIHDEKETKHIHTNLLHIRIGNLN